LQEEQQVIFAPGLESVPDILNPPKGCATRLAPGALAIQIQIAYVEDFLAFSNFFFVARIDTAGQAELGVVGDFPGRDRNRGP